MKIVVCGPPHSGKSVFVQQLRRCLLPFGVVGVIEGCPDGEGGWAGATDQGLVGDLRVKGKFTPQFVDWILQSVEKTPMSISLIDVGGIRSSENERIFEVATHFIVLANPAKVGEMAAWDAFGRANGCEPVALLESVLHGESVLQPLGEDGVIRGVQAGLERGTRVESPVIDALVARLLTEAGVEAAPGELEASVHTGRLADQLGVAAEDRDSRLGLRPWHAADIFAFSEEARSQHCRVWGACPSWTCSLLAAASQRCQLWDIRLGWVSIPQLAVVAAGSAHLTWQVSEEGSNCVVHFAIPGGVFAAGSLPEVTVPVVPSGARVVVSGRGPHWLTAAIARAYALRGHEVAVLSLHESDKPQLTGCRWADDHSGMMPAVVVAGSRIGEIIAISVGHAKAAA